MRIQLKVGRVLLVLVMMALMIHGTLKSGDCRVSPKDFNQNTSFEAKVGDNITLPCIPTFTFNKYDDFFEWLKGTEQITVIKEYTVNSIHANYTHRIYETALLEELDKGRASLNLHNVNQSDNGNFCCCIQNGERLCINVTLVVTSAGKETQRNNKAPGNSTECKTKCPDWVCYVLLPLFVVTTCISTGIAIYLWKKNKNERSKEGRGRPRSQNGQQENPEAVRLEVQRDNDERANIRNVRQRRQCFVV